MIVLGLLLAVAVVIAYRVRSARKGRASDPEGMTVLVTDPDRPATSIRYRFPGSGGQM